MHLTDAIIAQARKLRCARVGWEKIAKQLGVGEDRLRRRCDKGYAARRAANSKKARKRRKETASGHYVAAVAHRPPASVLAEREWCLAQPLTLAQALLGDPAPGRSALDAISAGRPRTGLEPAGTVAALPQGGSQI